jgi:DNA polymerase/3'-5' exonuclease PolX
MSDNLNPNSELIEQLEILLNQAKIGKDPNDKFRVKSYKDAIEKIKAITEKITEESQIPLTKTSKIYKKVIEFLEEGKINCAEKVGKTLDIYRELQLIAEVGPSKAKTLVDIHGITSMEQLGDNLHLLNDKQRIGYKYYKTDQFRIPRMEIFEHQEFYKNIIENIPDLEMTITGSFRREAPNSGDIDILVSSKTNQKTLFKTFVNSLISCGYLIDTLAYGDKKYMGYGSLSEYYNIPRRIDIIYCEPDEYPFTILYFTGSGPFNVKMREYASKLGYKLNEKGLFDLSTNKNISYNFKCERDIFEFLKISFVEPKYRIEFIIN